MAEKSYTSAISDTPLLGDTIGENLDAAVSRFPDRPALVDVPAGRRWTYAELAADVDALASACSPPASAWGTGSASGRRTAPSGC